MGLEPTTPGTTIRCSNHLSYMHHLNAAKLAQFSFVQKKKNFIF